MGPLLLVLQVSQCLRLVSQLLPSSFLLASSTNGLAPLDWVSWARGVEGGGLLITLLLTQIVE